MNEHSEDDFEQNFDIDLSKLAEDWEALLVRLEGVFDKRPADLNAVLFLIGVQELGKGHRHFTKEEKQDLMHIAICKVLSFSGVYQLEGLDADGWPHWKLVQKLPFVNLLDQEKLLKSHVIEYFKREVFQ
jgi:hypothetical protein